MPTWKVARVNNAAGAAPWNNPFGSLSSFLPVFFSSRLGPFLFTYPLMVRFGMTSRQGG